VAVRVAVDLDAGAMHALHPRVERVLRLGDVALVWRSDPRIRLAERHRPLGERTVDGVFGRGAEPDPLVAESGGDAGGDHRLEHIAARLVAHPLAELGALPHLLQRQQIAAFVVDARQAVANELLGDVRQALAVALHPLIGRDGRPGPDTLQRTARAIGDAAVEVALLVAVERPAGR